MNTINYYDWQKIYNDLAYTFVDLVSNIKYGDEKMDIEKLKKEINDIKDIDSLEDLLAEMRIKLEKSYDNRDERIIHSKFVVDKMLKEKFFMANIISKIDYTDLRIIIKNYDITINDVSEIINFCFSIDYRIDNIKFDLDGFVLVFIEKHSD